MTPEDFPVKAIAEIGLNIKREKIIYDPQVFPSCNDKIVEIGQFWGRTKFIVHHDGKGHFSQREFTTPEDRFKRIEKLKEKRLITLEEYEKKRKEILDEI